MIRATSVPSFIIHSERVLCQKTVLCNHLWQKNWLSTIRSFSAKHLTKKSLHTHFFNSLSCITFFQCKSRKLKTSTQCYYVIIIITNNTTVLTKQFLAVDNKMTRTAEYPQISKNNRQYGCKDQHGHSVSLRCQVAHLL